MPSALTPTVPVAPAPVRRTLPLAREAFVASARRDTPGTDLPRLVEVLDVLLAWSAARADRLVFRSESDPSGVIRFAPAGGSGVFWAARTVRGGAPTLELAPPAGQSLAPEDRARVRATFSAYSRTALADDDRLRIGFGALKNAAARDAVLALMDELLPPAGPGAPAAK